MVNSLVTLSSVHVQAQRLVGQIVNTLLKEGYQQDMAYRIALNQVEEWATSERTTTARDMVCNYHITPHPDGWVIRQPNSTNPCLVFNQWC